MSFFPPIVALFSLSSSYSTGCGSLLLGERGKSKVWLDNSELREQGLGLLVLDAGVDDNIITRNPVDWRGDSVLVASLKGVDDAEDLGCVAASRSRVRHNEPDCLLRVDHEDRANGERDALGVDVGGILVIKPVTRRQLGILFFLG